MLLNRRGKQDLQQPDRVGILLLMSAGEINQQMRMNLVERRVCSGAGEKKTKVEEELRGILWGRLCQESERRKGRGL
jgi:hypothetical protein